MYQCNQKQHLQCQFLNSLSCDWHLEKPCVYGNLGRVFFADALQDKMLRKVIHELWTYPLGRQRQGRYQCLLQILQFISTHHPTDPQASFTGSAHSNTPWCNIWRCLQCLDDTGWLAEWALANNIHLSHPESKSIKKQCKQSPRYSNNSHWAQGSSFSALLQCYNDGKVLIGAQMYKSDQFSLFIRNPGMEIQ